jgi:nucleoside-diphosphate-sugar epimerase
MAIPALIVTGASGIVGRNFLIAARDRFRIYAIARRPQQHAGVAAHPNVRWVQVDIGNRESLQRVSAEIRKQDRVEAVVHLAAYYDFENEERPDFQHTNIDGTRNVLDQARELGAKHFLFASSIAACEVPVPGGAIREDSPPSALFPYARSKRVGEEMVREYAGDFCCSIVRLAAVFSDWCEYAPLYVFLSTWLSMRWKARILGGRGTSAVPYIHVKDVSNLFLTLLGHGDLPRSGVYIASPNGATSHLELFERATHFHFGTQVEPIFMPKPLATLGVQVNDILGRLVNRRPFERPWMMDYVDRPLVVDASRTHEVLGWSPTPRLHVLRRVLFMIENMKADPYEWDKRNERAMKRPTDRPALVIHEAMMGAREAICDQITAYLQSPVRNDRFPHYGEMSYDELQWYVGLVYDLLMAAVRTGDRTLLLNYIQNLARLRFEGGFPASEFCDALLVISAITVEELLYKPEVGDFRNQVRDSITHSIALAIDGAQDAYEALATGHEPGIVPATARDERDLEEIVQRLNAFYRPVEPSSPNPPEDER